MILQALTRYYEILAKEEKVTEQGWCMGKVSYALDIDRSGQLQGVISLKKEVERGKKKAWIPSLIKVPEMVSRSSGVSANFLCDNSKYLLGIDQEGAGERSIQCFEAARKKHLEILDSVQNETARAVKNFFLTWEPNKARENPALSEKWEDIISGGNLIFFTGNGYAQEDAAVCSAWMEYLQKSADGQKGICLVTGEHVEISRIHSAIKGVQGAQSSGAALVSFNAQAFESYGKEQSYNAPVGKYAAYAYTTALNYLLAQREYVYRLGDTTIVFWAENGQEIYQSAFMGFMEPQADNQEVIRGIFENLSKGEAVDIQGIEIDPKQRFFILGLAPNAARLAVRFFYQDSFGQILTHLGEHYKRLEITKPSWDTQEYLGVWHMLKETVNQKSKDAKPMPGMAASVFEAILSGGRYPESLYSSVLMRIRAEQGNITRGRAGIVKAHLIRNYDRLGTKEVEFVGLNEKCKDIAYILGREFAILEAVQEAANPGLNTTIKDRYFNSACATPASVFPVLFKLKESHVRKLQGEKKGLQIRYEQQLTELQGMIEVGENGMAYPKRLSLEDQGMFILGYYHQIQKRYEKKEEK
ncbi:MAG: type I-C CRISPR-associated protein Cas8c/Csd1 [Blautia sp.]|jgi:CRISPR-associated protein Csd1